MNVTNNMNYKTEIALQSSTVENKDPQCISKELNICLVWLQNGKPNTKNEEKKSHLLRISGAI